MPKNNIPCEECVHEKKNDICYQGCTPEILKNCDPCEDDRFEDTSTCVPSCLWCEEHRDKKEPEECACCGYEIPDTKEHYDDYAGLCDFCYPGVPSEYEVYLKENGSCDCCKAGRQY